MYHVVMYTNETNLHETSPNLRNILLVALSSPCVLLLELILPNPPQK